MAPPVKEENKKQKTSLAKQIKNILKERSSNDNEKQSSKVKPAKNSEITNKIVHVDDPRPSTSKEIRNIKTLKEEDQVYDINGEDDTSSETGDESGNEVNEFVFEPNLEEITEEQQNRQLYGADYEHDKMIYIGNGTYCKRRILHMTLGSSHRQTHIARKLIEGVFKAECLQNCTFSGLPARAQGKERQNVTVHPLALKARTAIIDYSIAIGKQRKWKPIKSHVIERSMSQKLGEIKRRLQEEINV